MIARFKSCKYLKSWFKKCVMFVIVILCSFSFVHPIKADTDYFEVDFDIWGGYRYWLNHGMTSLNLSNITGEDFYINGLYANSTFVLNTYETSAINQLAETCQLTKITGSNPEAWKFQCNNTNSTDITSRGTVSTNTGGITFQFGQSGGTTEHGAFYSSGKDYLKSNINFLRGTYSNLNQYNYKYNSVVYSGEEFIIAFMISRSEINSSDLEPSIYMSSGDPLSVQVTHQDLGGYRLYKYRVINDTANTKYFDIDFQYLNGKTFSVIPIAFQSKNRLNDYVYSFLYGNRYVPYIDEIESKQNKQITNQQTQITNQQTQITNQQTQITNQNTIITRLNTLITNLTTGNSNSQAKETNMNNQASNINTFDNDFNDMSSSYETLESNSLNDMTISLNSLDLNGSNYIFRNNNFLNAINFVKSEFDYYVNNFTMIKNLISFSLMLGIALIILGKVRN